MLTPRQEVWIRTYTMFIRKPSFDIGINGTLQVKAACVAGACVESFDAMFKESEEIPDETS